MMLRKQIEIENDEFGKQNNVMIDERRCESNLCPTAPEHAPKTQYNKRNGGCSKVENDWIKPNKFAPMTYFFKKYKNEEEVTTVFNKYSVLTDENDADDEEECENEESCSDVTTKEDDKEITKATKMMVLMKKLRKETERVTRATRIIVFRCCL